MHVCSSSSSSFIHCLAASRLRHLCVLVKRWKLIATKTTITLYSDARHLARFVALPCLVALPCPANAQCSQPLLLPNKECIRHKNDDWIVICGLTIPRSFQAMIYRLKLNASTIQRHRRALCSSFGSTVLKCVIFISRSVTLANGNVYL